MQLQKLSDSGNEDIFDSSTTKSAQILVSKRWRRRGKTKKNNSNHTESHQTPHRSCIQHCSPQKTGSGWGSKYSQNITPWPTAQSPWWKISSKQTWRLGKPQLRPQNHPEVATKSSIWKVYVSLGNDHDLNMWSQLIQLQIPGDHQRRKNCHARGSNCTGANRSASIPRTQ